MKTLLKISYSCMRNVDSIIFSYKVKDDCPIIRECLTPNIVYSADVTNN